MRKFILSLIAVALLAPLATACEYGRAAVVQSSCYRQPVQQQFYQAPQVQFQMRYRYAQPVQQVQQAVQYRYIQPVQVQQSYVAPVQVQQSYAIAAPVVRRAYVQQQFVQPATKVKVRRGLFGRIRGVQVQGGGAAVIETQRPGPLRRLFGGGKQTIVIGR